jgi:hypothetical protein
MKKGVGGSGVQPRFASLFRSESVGPSNILPIASPKTSVGGRARCACKTIFHTRAEMATQMIRRHSNYLTRSRPADTAGLPTRTHPRNESGPNAGSAQLDADSAQALKTC